MCPVTMVTCCHNDFLHHAELRFHMVTLLLLCLVRRLHVLTDENCQLFASQFVGWKSSALISQEVCAMNVCIKSILHALDTVSWQAGC